LVDKWMGEAMTHYKGQFAEKIPKMFEYVIDELKYYLTLSKNGVEISPVDGVWQSDTLIPKDLKDRLEEGVRMIEDNKKPDWHPGSDKKVKNIIHQSMYPLVRGVTKDKRGKVIPLLGKADNRKHNDDVFESKKFQWLPSDFMVDKSSNVTIASYINNLDDENMKETIGEIFEKFVPLFNNVLTDLVNPRPNRINIGGDWYEAGGMWKEMKRLYEIDKKAGKVPFEVDNEEDDDEMGDMINEYYGNKLEPIQPKVPKFEKPVKPKMIIDIRNRKLQVIVKMANVELSPGKEYDGGVWHVEGMRNESIIATGIYYYDIENMTESKLSFRQAVSDIKIDYEQNDVDGVEQIYGLETEESHCNNDLGAIIAKKGRCIAFANIFQHKIEPFKLMDNKKEGYRNTLCFFLVDPNKEIISTGDIPPQQKHLGGSMTESQAEKFRLELMKERKFLTNENTKEIFERPVSLCEH